MRFEYAGAVYHVMARGDGGKAVFTGKDEVAVWGKIRRETRRRRPAARRHSHDGLRRDATATTATVAMRNRLKTLAGMNQ